MHHQEYNGCTKDGTDDDYWGAHGAGWCATSDNYDEDPDNGWLDCTCAHTHSGHSRYRE